MCSYLHPVIFHISNFVHLLFPNPFCLHLTECSAVLCCDSMAHKRELPPSQLHGHVIKCYALRQRQKCSLYCRGGFVEKVVVPVLSIFMTDCLIVLFFTLPIFSFSVFILSCASPLFLPSLFIPPAHHPTLYPFPQLLKTHPLPVCPYFTLLTSSHFCLSSQLFLPLLLYLRLSSLLQVFKSGQHQLQHAGCAGRCP